MWEQKRLAVSLCVSRAPQYNHLATVCVDSSYHRRVVLIGADWFRLTVTCWEFFCVYKLDSNYLQTFTNTNLSTNDPSRSELDHNCLETSCLPPGTLCICLQIESGWGCCVLNLWATRLSLQLLAIGCWIQKHLMQFFLVTRRLLFLFYFSVTEPQVKENGR